VGACLQEEATWSEGDSEWEIEGDEGMEDAAASPQGEAEGSACGHVQPGQQQAPPQQAEGGGGVDPAYINIFLLKFVCPVEGCGGTLAPLPPPGATDHFECNMCGRRRTEAEFLAELQADE
jgi:SET and MYND domain-containing protein